MSAGDLRLGLSPNLGGRVFVMREKETGGVAILIPQPDGYPYPSWAAWVEAHRPESGRPCPHNDWSSRRIDNVIRYTCHDCEEETDVEDQP